MFTLPAMIFMGIPGPIANGTNRLGILCQNISAITAFRRKGLSEFKLGFTLALCALPGAIAGAFMAVKIRGEHFNLILAIIMLIVMALTFFGNRKPPVQSDQPSQQKIKAVTSSSGRAAISPSRLFWGHISMILVGLWGGFIQIGVGFILIPILNYILGLDLLRTNVVKVTIVLIYTVVVLLIFASQLDIEWLAGFCIAFGMIAGAWIGARIQISKGTQYIKHVINIMLLIFIVKLLWEYITP